MYDTDPEFVSIYHGNSGWTVEQCAEDSWSNIKDLELHMFDFGYIAVNRFDLLDKLAGFFIKPEFRNSEIKARFFKEVNSLLKAPFTACVHSSNVKAVRFLSSVGEITKADNITTYIVFRKGD
jgi:hypothetical protein